MLGDAIALIEFLRANWQKYSVISALFDSNGTKIEGDERIAVEKLPVAGRTDQWFYRVRPVSEFVFVYMPVIPTVDVDFGRRGTNNPEASLFRFVGNMFSSVISGGNANVLVDFVVIGYKPKVLLAKHEST